MKHSFMHHSRFESKKARVAFRSFIYGMMTISTIVISALSLLLVLGYRFDRKNLSFEQGGLIQFVSSPEGAVVNLDGVKEDFRTPGKTTATAALHDVKLSLSGYKDWQKQVEVKPGAVLWLNYARMVPKKLSTQSTRSFDAVNSALTSPNHRYIALQTSAEEPKLTLATIRNYKETEYQEIIFPATSYATAANGAKHDFKLLEWNAGSRYVLVYHTVNDVREFLRVDRERPENVVNISGFHANIDDVRFAEVDGDRVYALQDGNLRILDVNSTDARNIVNSISAYQTGRGGVIAYLAEREGMLELIVRHDNNEKIIKTLAVGAAVKFDANNYFGDDYVALVYGNTAEVFRDPLGEASLVKRFTIDAPTIEWISFSENGRLLSTQNQGRMTVYDLELDKLFSYSIEHQQNITRPFQWLDNYYLWTDVDGSLRIFEYDGTNQSVISSVKDGLTISLAENGKGIYSFGNQKPSLQYTSLVVEKN